MSKRTVFLDRDNTIIADPGFVSDPDKVQLLPGSAESIKKLNEEGFTVVVVSNQSGVARGLITVKQLNEVHERIRELLLEQGARIDAIYYCPYLHGPEAKLKRYNKDSNLRKPKPGMLLKAAHELDLALPDSWMIGNESRDVQAGIAAGCRTILLSEASHASTNGAPRPDFVAPSLREAAQIVIENQERSSPANSVESPTDADEAPPEESGDRQQAADPHEDIKGDRLAPILTDIRDMLRRRERIDRQEDFSIARLLATLMQMLAIVAGIWGATSLAKPSVAFVRLLLAIFLQLVALTAFTLSKRSR